MHAANTERGRWEVEGGEYLKFCFHDFNRAGYEGGKHPGTTARNKRFDKLRVDLRRLLRRLHAGRLLLLHIADHKRAVRTSGESCLL